MGMDEAPHHAHSPRVHALTCAAVHTTARWCARGHPGTPSCARPAGRAGRGGRSTRLLWLSCKRSTSYVGQAMAVTSVWAHAFVSACMHAEDFTGVWRGQASKT